LNSNFASWIKFNTVGLLGAGVQLVMLTFFKSVIGLNYLLATIAAVETSVIHNFVWHERWTWAHRMLSASGVFARLLRFNAGNGLVSIAGNVVVMWLFVSKLHFNYLIANVIAIGSCAMANFLISDRVVFKVNS